jgi:hypothetical protein
VLNHAGLRLRVRMGCGKVQGVKFIYLPLVCPWHRVSIPLESESCIMVAKLVTNIYNVIAL